MTRLFLHAGRIRTRLILALLGCVLFFGLTVGLSFHAFLGLSERLLHQQLLIVAGIFVWIFVVLAVFSYRWLAPVSRLLVALREQGGAASSDQSRARHAVLSFPLLLVQVTLLAATVAILGGVAIDLLLLELPPRLVTGMALGLFSVALVASTFFFVVSRSLVRPIAAHFRQEEVPPGVRVSVKNKVLLATVALALASAVPTGVICARRIHVLRDQTQQRHARHLAEAVAYGGTVLGPDALRQAVAATHLDGARVHFGSQGGTTSSPLPAGHLAPYVDVLAVGDTTPDHSVLAFLVVTALALSILVGSLLGLNLSHDVALLAARIAPIGERGRVRPMVTAIPQFSDLRALASALNVLLVRIAEIHVTHFVAIETTLAADRVKMQFLANVSHDLRSPLNAILGFSELLLRETQGSFGRQRIALQTIQRAGGELLHLVDEVLDLAKLEAGWISLHREDSMPTLLVNQAIQEVRHLGLPDGVMIETELQAGLPLVWVDPHRVQQAIQHLLRFSLQHLERGEITIRVRTENLPEPTKDGAHKMLLIRIADTGRGFAGEEVAQLFVGFRRKTGVRGLGLGIPLAKVLIEMHGGTLQILSTPGVGTTFAVDLPVLQKKVLGRLRPVPV